MSLFLLLSGFWLEELVYEKGTRCEHVKVSATIKLIMYTPQTETKYLILLWRSLDCTISRIMIGEYFSLAAIHHSGASAEMLAV